MWQLLDNIAIASEKNFSAKLISRPFVVKRYHPLNVCLDTIPDRHHTIVASDAEDCLNDTTEQNTTYYLSH